jgi:hypothetical protein
VGPNAGIPVEDLGVTPDEVLLMAGREFMVGNHDLIEETGEVLTSAIPTLIIFSPLFEIKGGTQ